MPPLLRLNEHQLKSKHNGPSIPCIDCTSRRNCLHKTLDVDRLEKLPNQYVHKFKIKKGDPIFHSGDDIHSIYNMKIGFAKVEYALPNGQHQINQFAIPGDLLGLDGIADGKHHLDAYALSDGEVCGISFSQLKNIMKLDSDISSLIERSMSEALNSTQEHIFSLGTHGAEEKLAYFLIDYRNRLSRLSLRTDTLRLPMSREDLRSYLGVTIETLSRSFTYLENNGFIRVKNREIIFIDSTGLERFISAEDLKLQLSHQIYGVKKFTTNPSFYN